MDDPHIDSVGTKRWFKDGNLHRDKHPAVMFENGIRYWYENNQLHNEHGPAVIYPNGDHIWFLNNHPYSFDDYCDKLELPNEDRLLLKIQYS